MPVGPNRRNDQIRRFLYRHPDPFRSVRGLGARQCALSMRVRSNRRLFIPVAPSVAPGWWQCDALVLATICRPASGNPAAPRPVL